MANKKLSEYSPIAAATANSIIPVVDNSTGTLENRYITAGNLWSGFASTISLTVAANNAPARDKLHADYICDGVHDEVEIQAAIDALPAIGGKVNLSAGTFVVYDAGHFTGDTRDQEYCIGIDDTDPAICIEGVPGLTILKLADNQLFNPGGDLALSIILLWGSQASPRTASTYIRGIVFDGNVANQPGVNEHHCVSIYTAHDVKFEWCEVHDFKGQWAFHVAYKSRRTTITNNYFYQKNAIRLDSSNYLVQNNTIEVPAGTPALGDYGIQLTPDYDVGDGHTAGSVIGNLFIGGRFQIWGAALIGVNISNNIFTKQWDNVGNCIYMTGDDSGGGWDMQYNVFSHNIFYDVCMGIEFASGVTHGCTKNIVSFNQFIDGPDYAFVYGFRSSGAATGNNTIEFNNFPAVTSVNITSALADVVRYNDGYVTENRGAAAAVSDGGTIAHGLLNPALLVTPTWANVTPSVAGEMVTITSLDPTNITVAIKKHDGTPGTAQTLYWEAEV